MKNALLMTVALTAVLSFAWTNTESASAAEKAPGKATNKAAGKASDKTQTPGQTLDLKELSFTFPSDFGANVHTTEYLGTDGLGKLPKEHYLAQNKAGETLEVTFAGYPEPFKYAYNAACIARDELLVRLTGGITKENLTPFGDNAEGLSLYYTVAKPDKKILQGRAYFLAKMPRYRYEVIFQTFDPKRLDAPEISKAFDSFKAKDF